MLCCNARIQTDAPASENSEDAVAWNVFRSLCQIDPVAWLPLLFERGFDVPVELPILETTVELWQSVAPPMTLLQNGDEGISEISIVIENPGWVWFIGAKLTSDVPTCTTTRPDRDQVLRNLDVGFHHTGVRDYFFSLLIRDKNRSPKRVQVMEKYKDLDRVRDKLPHRPDRLKNLRAIGLLAWSHPAQVLDAARFRVKHPDELA